MKLDINRVDIWVAGIEDRPGGLTEKLRGLGRQARIWSSFWLAAHLRSRAKRSCSPHRIKGGKQMKAAGDWIS